MSFSSFFTARLYPSSTTCEHVSDSSMWNIEQKQQKLHVFILEADFESSPNEVISGIILQLSNWVSFDFPVHWWSFISVGKIWEANILQENMNCHLVHQRVTFTYENIWFNQSRRAVFMSCVTDHQHCSRNLFFFFHIHSNLIIYDGYVIFFEQVGVGEEALSDFFVGHPFSSWGIKDHRCVTPLMWSKEEEKEELQIWHRCTLEILIHSHQVHVGRWRSSLINSCTCHTLRLHRQSLSFRFTVDGHFLFFLHFPSLLSFLAGRIKFYCIVYDRYEARFGANSRQTTHSHFMVSFHLTR